MQAETSRALIQVAPPGTGGVFDYLHCLKAEWAAHGVASHVLALSKEQARQRPLAAQVHDLAGESACTVVLHFSGYGYGQRGLCFWLLDALQDLRAKRGLSLRLVVVFHELFATGEPPWRSAFWLSRLQAVIAARMAGLADAVWTNTEQHARWLRQAVGPSVEVRVRPVFSNVGQLEAPLGVRARKPQAVVFGSSSTRQRVFDAMKGRRQVLYGLGVESLVEVGSGGPSSQHDAGLPCHFLGRLDTPDLSRLLRLSRFGLLDYPPQFLGKSGVFAAYASHGCVVLDTSRPGPDTDGLVAGQHYLPVPPAATATPGMAELETRAAALARWYAAHSLPRQARELLALAGVT
jgi:hypothetical protein